MRVLIKNAEEDLFAAAEAYSLELDSPEGGMTISTDDEYYLIRGISRKKAEELIREAYVSGRVDLTKWDVEVIDTDFLINEFGDPADWADDIEYEED